MHRAGGSLLSPPSPPAPRHDLSWSGLRIVLRSCLSPSRGQPVAWSGMHGQGCGLQGCGGFPPVWSVPARPGMQNTGASEPWQVRQPTPWAGCGSACPHPRPEKSLAVSTGRQLTSFLAGQWRCQRGCLCRMELEKIQDIRGAQPPPGPQERWIKAILPPGLTTALLSFPSPAPNLASGQMSPGWRCSRHLSLIPGEAPRWTAAGARNCSQGLLLLLQSNSHVLKGLYCLGLLGSHETNISRGGFRMN